MCFTQLTYSHVPTSRATLHLTRPISLHPRSPLSNRTNNQYDICSDLISRTVPVRFPAFEMYRGVSPAPSSPDVCNGYSSAPVGLAWYSGPSTLILIARYSPRYSLDTR